MSEVTSTKPNNRDYPRIVFMGTPDFAVASLDALVKAGCNIVGVVTAPDKPAGRGMKITESAVKKICSSKRIEDTTTRKIKKPFIHRGTPFAGSRFADSSCFSHAPRNHLEYAPNGYG